MKNHILDIPFFIFQSLSYVIYYHYIFRTTKNLKEECEQFALIGQLDEQRVRSQAFSVSDEPQMVELELRAPDAAGEYEIQVGIGLEDTSTVILESRHIRVESCDSTESPEEICSELYGVPVPGGTLDETNFLQINGQRISGFEISEGDHHSQLRVAINARTDETGVRAETTQDRRIRLISESPFEVIFIGNGGDVTGLGSGLYEDHASCEPLPMNTCEMYLGGVRVWGGILDEASYLTINGQKISGFRVKSNDFDHKLRNMINTLIPFTGVRAELTPDHRVRLTAEGPIQVSVDGNADEITGLVQVETGEIVCMPLPESVLCTTAYGSPFSGGTLDESNFITINQQRISGFTVLPNDENEALRAQINALTDLTGVRAELNGRRKLVLISDQSIRVETHGEATLAITGFSEEHTSFGGMCMLNPEPLGCFEYTGNTIQGGVLDEVNFIVINGKQMSGFTVEPNDEDDQLLESIRVNTEDISTFVSINEDAQLVIFSNEPIEIFVSGDAGVSTGLESGIYHSVCE